jgi:3-deoxy-D-manno-octulosonic-acid transferase
MLFLYRLLSIILSPIIDIYFLIRIIKSKEHKSRFLERYGFHSKIKNKDKLIWIHAASVGESNSALKFITKLQNHYPNHQILFTSGTVTSAKILEEKLPKNIIHQFVPIDKFFTARRFIKYWKPNIVIFFESEIWINLLNFAHKYGAKLTLINARISNKSFQKWQKYQSIQKLFAKFELIIAQSKKDQEKFQELAKKEIFYFGNLKEDIEPKKIDQNLLQKFQKQLQNRQIIFAASTHQGEEEIIINLHHKLQKNINNIFTIIAIRHPHRRLEIEELLPQNVKFFSDNPKITKNDNFLIIDEIGYMDLFYQLTDLSIICGSFFDNIGGHNPYEALQYNNIIFSGHYVANFDEIYQKLSQKEICHLIKDENELYFYILKNLKDIKYKIKKQANVRQFIKNHESILDQTIQKFISNK